MTDSRLFDVISQYTGLFLTGGLGAYLGSYLKKKGENLATREDLDKLIEQVSAVTAATQRIEARTTRSLRVYERQLDILARLYRHLNDAQALFQNMTRAGRMQNEIKPAEYATHVDKSMKAAYEEFLDGRLFIPSALVQVCETFFNTVLQGLRDFTWAHEPMIDGAKRAEFWDKAADTAHKQVPKILQQIEEAARALINGEAT